MTALRALGLQLWAFGFVAFMGSELLVTEPTLRVMAQVGWVAPVAVWAAWRLRGPRTGLDWAILGALVAMLVVALASADPQGSMDSLGLAVAYALAFWAMREVGARPRLRAAVAVAVSYALTGWLALVAVFWILEKVGWFSVTGTLPALESSQVFIWGTTNAFPLMALLALPFIAWQRPGRPRRLLFVVWAAATVVVIPLSMGRAAWLGIAVAVAVLEPLNGWPVTRATQRRLARRPLVTAGLGLALVAVVVVAVMNASGQVASGVGGDRLRIWGQALGIFVADPLTGGGPGTFSWLRLAHVPDYVYPVPVRLAHDVPLQTLADGGLLLFAAFGVVVITLLVTAWHAAGARTSRLSVAVLIGVAVACLLDDFSSLPALMAVTVTLAAWVAPVGPTPMEADSRRWILPAALVLLAVIALPNVAGVDRARLAAADGRRAAVAGDWSVAVERFEAATAAYPGIAGYWLGLGVTSWHAGDEARANEAFLAAYERNAYDPRTAGALAAVDRSPLVAREHLDEAIRHGITDPQYAFRLGTMLEADGENAASIDAFGLAVAIDPSLITVFADAETQRDIASAALRQVPRLEALDGYVLRPQVAWDLGLFFGTLPQDAPAAWRAVLAAARGDLETARALADEAMAAGPEEHAVRAAAAVARYGCDTDREMELIEVVGQRPALRPSELRDVRDHTYRDQSLGSYQPLATDPYPPRRAWPWSLVGEPPEC